MSEKEPSSKAAQQLQDGRARITEITVRILELIGERNKVSAQIAKAKETLGKPTTDKTREEQLIAEMIKIGERYGINETETRGLLEILISTSKRTQENTRQND